MQLYTIVLPLLAGFISVASALPVEARDNGLVARENIDARDTLATRAGRPSYLDKDGFVIDVTECLRTCKGEKEPQLSACKHNCYYNQKNNDHQKYLNFADATQKKQHY